MKISFVYILVTLIGAVLPTIYAREIITLTKFDVENSLYNLRMLQNLIETKPELFNKNQIEKAVYNATGYSPCESITRFHYEFRCRVQVQGNHDKRQYGGFLVNLENKKARFHLPTFRTSRVIMDRMHLKKCLNLSLGYLCNTDPLEWLEEANHDFVSSFERGRWVPQLDWAIDATKRAKLPE